MNIKTNGSFNLFFIFERESDGIYSDPNYLSSSYTFRFVAIVGYGHDPLTGLDYWIVRGSYGTSWGMKGYMYVQRGVNYCQIEFSPQFAVAAFG